MITSKILPESPRVPLFRHDQYDDITEFGHSLEIVNVQLEFLVTVYFVQKASS